MGKNMHENLYTCDNVNNAITRDKQHIKLQIMTCYHFPVSSQQTIYQTTQNITRDIN